MSVAAAINADIDMLNRQNYNMPQHKIAWANPFLVPSDNKLLATLVAMQTSNPSQQNDRFCSGANPWWADSF